MSAITQIQQSDIPLLGTPIGGGFAVSPYRHGNQLRLLIVSGKEHEFRGEWENYGNHIAGADSYYDGVKNTIAMAEADSGIAQRVLNLRAGDADDWSIAARDQKELIYRAFKPTPQQNFCSFRDGENPSAMIATYPYTPELPAQTSIAEFMEGGAQAFLNAIYWTSTQYSALNAWVQDFADGLQDYSLKDLEFAVRSVRSILIIQ